MQLTDEHIQHLSSITELSPMQLKKLISMGLIDGDAALDVLMKYDYRRIKRRNVYRVAQIQQAMADKYHVPVSRVARVVYSKKKKMYYCEACGKNITSREYKLGKGKCKACVAREINGLEN